MNKTQINKFLGNRSLNIVEAMRKIDLNAKGILFVVTENNELIGTVTDGDIRRALIETGNLGLQIVDFMNCNPMSVKVGEQKKAYELQKQLKLNAIPVIDADKRIKDIIFGTDEEVEVQKNNRDALQDISVVIMAGGKGTRLYPYTKILPKPLIPLGDVPIVERIMDRFNDYGVNNFYMTVNYKKNMIKSYLAEQVDYKIIFIEEEKPLGTAGSLKMFPVTKQQNFFVTNCDILIDADYDEIYRNHVKAGNMVTIVSALKSIEIPYGVIQSSVNGNVSALEEKPQMSYFINTGMYILNKECLKWIPGDVCYHMTDLLDKLLFEGQKVGMYPVSEDSFLDMGEWEELQRMERKLKENSNHK